MTHPLVRAAVTGELRGADEAALHRRAYEVLRDDGARSSVAVTHALKAGPAGDPGVVELLTRSSTRALRNGSPQVAAVHLRRALAEPPTPRGARPGASPRWAGPRCARAPSPTPACTWTRRWGC